MRILVTGGAGYVGGFAARHLAEARHEVVVLDDLSQGHAPAAPAGSLVIGDVADSERVRTLLRERRIEGVMHFAASSTVGPSVTDPALYYRNNVSATLSLLESMMACDVKRIVFSSSCSIFGAVDEPIHEELPRNPESPYAFTKHVMEQAMRDFARAYGLHYTLLRYFNAAGAAADATHGEDHDPESHLLPILLEAALGRREGVKIFGNDYPTPDGTCIRDYVHVEDLARAHETAMLALEDTAATPRDRAYNLGTGTGHSVLECVQSVERVTGEKLNAARAPRRPGDAPSLVAQGERARNELGWVPQYGTLDEIISTAWQWHRTHPDGYSG